MNVDKDLYIQFLESLVKKQTPVVSTATTRTRTRRPMHKWTDSERALLLELYSKGNTVAEIVQITGLRRSQVDNQLYTLLRRNEAK